MNTDLTKTEGTEQKQVEKRTSIGAHIVLEAVRHEGEEELGRSSSALAWSGLAAGLSMGFSFIAEALPSAHLPDAPCFVAGKNEESEDRYEKSASAGRRVARRAG